MKRLINELSIGNADAAVLLAFVLIFIGLVTWVWLGRARACDTRLERLPLEDEQPTPITTRHTGEHDE